MSFEDMERGIEGVVRRITLTAHEQADWWIRTHAVGNLTLHVGQDGGPNFYEGQCARDCIFGVMALAGRGIVRLNGRELGPGTFATLPSGSAVTAAAETANRYVIVRIPTDILTARPDCDAPTLRALTASMMVWRPVAAALARLEAAMAFGCSPDWAVRTKYAEDELLTAILGACTAAPELPRVRPGRPAISRERILSRALEVMAEREHDVVYVDDLCQAAGVCERTLRSVFHDYFGVGPIRYLHLRQFHKIRAALRAADRSRDTVTGVSSNFGIWDFGRFAAEYRTLFGERPSQSLGAARGSDASGLDSPGGRAAVG